MLPALILGLAIAPASYGAAFASPSLRTLSAGAENTVAVLTVTQEVIEHTEPAEICWQTIVSDRERARRRYESQPWVVKHWKPLLGGVLGGAVGYQFTGNYGDGSQGWVYPTILAGVAVGAVAGPGMVLGAYGGGSLAEHFWPGETSRIVALSLVGGILGDGLMKLLFPDSPSKALLADPQPGQYYADQQFFLETSCADTTRVTKTESPYRATYRYQGEVRNALFRYYPGERIKLDGTGRPVNEMRQQPDSPAVRVRTVNQH